MPPPSSCLPSNLPSRAFRTAFRGYDPREVRAFLAEVQVELDGCREREKARQAELAAAREATAASLDEAAVAGLLGDEAGRLLTTAQRAAQQIRSRAEHAAQSMLLDAQDEAARLRTAAQEDVARLRREAADELERVRRERDDVGRALAQVERAVAAASTHLHANGAGEPAPAPEPAPTPIQDVLARIRADRARALDEARAVLARTETPQPEAQSDAAEPDDEPAPEAAGHALARLLKRALADDQNEVLDRLRRAGEDDDLGPVLRSRRERARHYRDACAPSLRDLADAFDVEPALALLDADLVEPLQADLERVGSDAAPGDLAVALQAIYREWRTQRIDPLAGELVLIVHGLRHVVNLAG